MSDASPVLDLGPPRRLRDAEHDLIAILVKGTSFEEDVRRELVHSLVQDMPDGGMGSVKFFRAGAVNAKFGKQIAEGSFTDADGVPVSVTLNLGDDGKLFEFDVWKVDNSPLISYPRVKDFAVVNRGGKPGYHQP